MKKRQTGTGGGNKPTIRNIARFLNRTLRVPRIEDSSRNGLQVRSTNAGVIGRVGFGVDADLATFRRANDLGVDMLVVHHGIAWRPQKDRALEQKRASYLKQRDIALYAVHLPLDLHETYGNNAQLADLLGLKHPQKFGRYHGLAIGFSGMLAKTVPPDALALVLNRKLHTRCRVLGFGKERVRNIGVVSGGGGSTLQEAVAKRLDCLVVGEIDLAVHNNARDHGMNLIVAGHYATETTGVKALMPLVAERFGVDTVFVNEPKVW